MPSRPPPFEANIILKKRFRYTCTTTGTSTFTFIDLFSCLADNFNPGVAAYSLFCAIKLRKIQLWSTGTASGTISIQVVNLTAGPGAKPILLSDTSYNAAQIAKLCYVPNKQSILGDWINTMSTTQITANPTFAIEASNGDTMDITLETILNTNQLTPALNLPTTSSTASGNVIDAFSIPLAAPTWIPILTTQAE